MEVKYPIPNESEGELLDFVHSTVVKIGRERARLLGEHIKLCLQPKPRLLPQSFWHKILKRVLVVK